LKMIVSLASDHRESESSSSLSSRRLDSRLTFPQSKRCLEMGHVPCRFRRQMAQRRRRSSHRSSSSSCEQPSASSYYVVFWTSSCISFQFSNVRKSRTQERTSTIKHKPAIFFTYQSSDGEQTPSTPPSTAFGTVCRQFTSKSLDRRSTRPL
jgi:hypothetical protein